jgi:hypothetical protein
LRFHWNEFLLEHALRPSMGRYVKAQHAIVRLTRLRWIAEHGSPDLPAPLAGEHAVAEIDSASLFGVHGLERHDGQRFRWTHPDTALRLAPADHPRSIRIDTGALRGPPASYLTSARAGGARLAVSSDERSFTVTLPARATLLVLRARRMAARADKRRLGIPIVSVTVA